MPFTKNTTGKPRKYSPPEYAVEGWFQGKVTVTAMSRIIGIRVSSLRALLESKKIPSEIHRNRRFFDVDEVMEWGFNTKLPFPVFKVKKADHLADALWAWDAISMQPWNCPRAPSGRAWRLYLDGKKDMHIRRSLARVHMVYANRKLAKIGDWTPEPDTTDELAKVLPKREMSAPVSKPEPDRELSAAELCMEGLEKGYLDGPLSVPAETGY